MTATMTRTSVLSVGSNKNRPRIWVEGKYLEALGFAADSAITVEFGSGRIEVRLAQDGGRKVSSRRDRPIIDMNTAEINNAIGNAEKVEVRGAYGVLEIVPAQVEQQVKARVNDRSRTVGSIFSGGGLLDEAAKQAGLTPTFAVELDPNYADIYQKNHAGRMFQGSIAEVPLHELPKVEVLVGGIPCEPFSTKRRNAGNEKCATAPEDHPLADMTVWALMAIRQANPRVVVLEEAPAYLDHAAGKILVACLGRMGYTVETRVIEGTAYGSLCVRKRAVIVAKTGGAIVWPNLCSTSRTLADILLPTNDPRCEWFTQDTKSWLFDHWAKQQAKGNGFSSRILTPELTQMPAVTKRYFNGQGDGAVVQHPTRSGTYRWLTLVEVQRLMGLPDTYNLGATKTTAGEIMGQGVLVDVFARIIRSVVQ